MTGAYGGSLPLCPGHIFRDSDFPFQKCFFSISENLEVHFNWAEKWKFHFAIDFVQYEKNRNSVYIRFVYKTLAQPIWNGSAVAPKKLMNIAKNLGLIITLTISLMLF